MYRQLIKFQSNTLLFHSLRAVAMALRLKKSLSSTKYKSFFFRLCFFLWSCFGGTTITSMLQGIPCNWFISPVYLPIYLFWHAIIFEIPQLKSLWQGIHSRFEPVFDFILAFGRGFSLAFGMDNFKNHPTHSSLTREAYLSQFIIGILSSCGSSLTLNWMVSAWDQKRDKEEGEETPKRKSKSVKQAIKHELYPHPGIDLNICASISLFNLLLTQPHLLYQIIENVPNSNILASYLQMYGIQKNIKISREESGVYCAILMMASVIYKRAIK